MIAKDKGIRVRKGHTEATVDLAYIADAEPVTVIIEILNQDGKMARRDAFTRISRKGTNSDDHN